MTCRLCHKPYIPEVPGMTPAILTIGEDESFQVHEHCFNEVQVKAKTLNRKAWNVFLSTILKQMSN